MGFQILYLGEVFLQIQFSIAADLQNWWSVDGYLCKFTQGQLHTDMDGTLHTDLWKSETCREIKKSF